QAVQRAIERRQQRIALSWAITLPDDGEPRGFIGLIPEGHMAELSYILAQEAWGRGYASEAARAVIESAMELSGVDRIWAMCDVGNLGSARVLEKVGMQLAAQSDATPCAPPSARNPATPPCTLGCAEPGLPSTATPC